LYENQLKLYNGCPKSAFTHSFPISSGLRVSLNIKESYAFFKVVKAENVQLVSLEVKNDFQYYRKTGNYCQSAA
jgi:hypothetical protein